MNLILEWVWGAIGACKKYQWRVPSCNSVCKQSIDKKDPYSLTHQINTELLFLVTPWSLVRRT